MKLCPSLAVLLFGTLLVACINSSESEAPPAQTLRYNSPKNATVVTSPSSSVASLSSAPRSDVTSHTFASTTSSPGNSRKSSTPITLPNQAVRCTDRFGTTDFEQKVSVHTLGEVEQHIHSKRVREIWDHELKGTNTKDRLGLTLPNFMSKEQILRWTNHPNPSGVTIVAARQWTESPQQWVVMASSDETRFAVIEIASGGSSISVLSQSAAPFVVNTDWTILPKRFRPDPQLDPKDNPMMVDSFDFSPYHVTKNNRAFGVRSRHTVAYSGGFAVHEVLTIVSVSQNQLIPVLSTPATVVSLTAGPWNKDGSRQHTFQQLELIVDVRREADPLTEFVLHPYQEKHSLHYNWSPRSQSFSCE